MTGRADEFDAQLAERGDDRPGLDDLEVDDFSALLPDDDEDDDVLLDEDAEGVENDDAEDDDEDDDYPEDALEEEIDLVAALYREDGRPAAIALPKDLANDFDELVEQLRRVPGDAGAIGIVVIDSDFFVLVRVRGKRIEVLLSDAVAANDWPIARDAADFLGEEIPEDEEDGGPVGDFAMFADAGLSEFELERLCGDLDADPVDLVSDIAEKLGFGPSLKKVLVTLDL
nr:tRNA adenosine deaminase-associated protein [Propionibacterium sp.]